MASDEPTVKERRLCEHLALGLTKKAAGAAAGITDYSSIREALAKPRVQNYLAELQRQEAERLQISRDDVIRGMQDAIMDAKLLSDPMSQIRGWSEIGKILGHYTPEKKEITLTAEQAQALGRLQSMDEQELLTLAGPDVIDGEWFEELEAVGEIIEAAADEALEDNHFEETELTAAPEPNDSPDDSASGAAE